MKNFKNFFRKVPFFSFGALLFFKEFLTVILNTEQNSQAIFAAFNKPGTKEKTHMQKFPLYKNLIFI